MGGLGIRCFTLLAMMNICLREDYRYIEQLSNGDWLVRYGMVSAGHTPDGRELVSFGSSEYPEQPSLEQIRHSIYRYAMAHLHDEEILATVCNPDMSAYDKLSKNYFFKHLVS